MTHAISAEDKSRLSSVINAHAFITPRGITLQPYARMTVASCIGTTQKPRPPEKHHEIWLLWIRKDAQARGVRAFRKGSWFLGD